MRSSYQNLFGGSRRQSASVVLALALCVALAASPSYGVVAMGTPQRAAQSNGFDEGRRHVASGEWAKAERALLAYVEAHPRGANADAAYYWLAFAMQRQNKLRQAGQVLHRLTQEFPRSAWADDARLMRVEIAAQVGDSEVLAEAARNPSADVAKLVALQSISKNDPERAVGQLLEVIRPGSGAGKAAKEAAINLLAVAGATQAAPLLAEMARGESDAELRMAATRALGRVGGEGELQLLEDLARSEGENDLGYAAVFALAQHKSPRAAEFLVELARVTESERTRQRVIISLGMREAGAAEALMRVYEASSDFDVKREVIISLYRRSERPGGEEAKGKLIEIARGAADAAQRGEAIMWLGRLQDESAVENLVQLYDAATDEATKDAVISALGRSFGRTPEQRQRAQRKLSEIAAADVSEALRNRAAFWLAQDGNGGGPLTGGVPASPSPGAKAPGALDAASGGAKGPGGLNAASPQAKAPGGLDPSELRREGPRAKGVSSPRAQGSASPQARGPVGAPGSLSPEAKAPGALTLPSAADVPAAAAKPTQGFVEIGGADLAGRMASAVAAGRGAKARGFWVGYAFDVRPGLAYKAAVANPEAGGTQSFDGPVPAGSPLETRNLAVFIHYGAGGGFDRVEIFNLDRGQQQYGGRPVYWLGRAGTSESLSYLRGVADSARDGATLDQTVTAIALHNAAGRGGDEALDILADIARRHPTEFARGLAARWVRQLGGR